MENEKKIRAELKALGMIFVKVEKEAFIEKGQKAIYESLSLGIQEVFKTVTTEII